MDFPDVEVQQAIAWWLPMIIGGATSVFSSLWGSRSQGKAAEVSAQASDRAAELQFQSSREQLQQLREIYNQDVALNWPRYRFSTEATGMLAKGVGSKLDSSVFDTSADPPKLSGMGDSPDSGPDRPGASRRTILTRGGRREGLGRWASRKPTERPPTGPPVEEEPEDPPTGEDTGGADPNPPAGRRGVGDRTITDRRNRTRGPREDVRTGRIIYGEVPTERTPGVPIPTRRPAAGG